jgi:hypothetical protein
MKTTQFITPTVMDPKSWQMIGISAKPNSDNPIGMFGTGLKYAIAICSRLGWSIEILTVENGEKKLYKFDTIEEPYRGTILNVITCNGDRLPYTSIYGQGWDNWMVMRELYSNTVDENGYMTFYDDREELNDNSTCVTIFSDEFHDIANEKDLYILPDRKLSEKPPNIELLSGKYSGRVYFKGIYVGKSNIISYGYSFNEVKIALTEDRTIKSIDSVLYDIAWHFQSSHDAVEIEKILLAKEELKSVHFYGVSYWSSTFKEVAYRLYSECPTKLNISVFKAINENKDKEFTIVQMSVSEELMLASSIMALKKAGFNTGFPVVKIENNDESNIAFVTNKKVHLTERSFTRGLEFLTSTLIEEFSHCQGFYDNDIAYEQHLCNELARMVLSHQSVMEQFNKIRAPQTAREIEIGQLF